jgi:ABC-type lipoprotein export system ATPase subunit
MLEVRNLSFSYPNGHTFRFPDIILEKGAQLALTGSSGSGKTTFLHLLAGILKAQSGSVIIKGTNIQQPGFTGADSFRGSHIGLIFQKHIFLDALTMTDNLLLAQSIPGLKIDRSYLTNLLEELGISHLASRFPRKLSQGELQRFSVARALANKPFLLLADEPTSSLDDDNCHRFINLIREQSAKHQSLLILATHDSRLKKEFDMQIKLNQTP